MRARPVLIVYREAMLGEALAAALGRHPGIVPIGVATTLEDAETQAPRAESAVIDDRLLRAEELAARLRKGGMRVVMIGQGSDADGGTVSTRMPLSSLAAALVPELRFIRNGGPKLTPRQREIVSLVSRGFAAKQVARQLGISVKTVENHKTRIFARLGVPNQTAAVTQLLVDDRAREDHWIPSSI
jgi:DNA-binding CsgD family transcriptional regulator